jgi:hypothetical protein
VRLETTKKSFFYKCVGLCRLNKGLIIIIIILELKKKRSGQRIRIRQEEEEYKRNDCEGMTYNLREYSMTATLERGRK